MSDSFFKKNKFTIIALVLYVINVVLFTDLTNNIQIITLFITILTLPIVFNYKIMSNSIWISLVAGASISLYLSAPGFKASYTSEVNSLITFPHQDQFLFWSLILILNTLHSFHRHSSQSRLTKLSETKADKRGYVLDELLSPTRKILKKINFFL